ncbi:MAG: hypothetical protein IJF02_04215 [Oscillospiraceae bacterium]|nr:hypothetical protein [Oscillospiraceae bacterium]
MNLVFVGFKHRHTSAIFHEAMANPDITVLGAWEDTAAGRALADGTVCSSIIPLLNLCWPMIM